MGYGRLTGRQVLGVLPTVVVNAETGSTITLSKGALALNAVENNGVWTFTCPTFGTWIASDGNKTSAVEVDDIKLYNTEISSATVYGFHIDSSVSDPSEAVTYLEDAVGMTPAYMDFDNDTFNYGSWENAFFMPKPCMLKFDGTVDYYLDPDDYTKKADGTASDIADNTYDGNAMMEWGQNDKKIWYKIVPDTNDNTSASIYISDTQVDSGYHAWSFINNDGVMVDHFYTAIYTSGAFAYPSTISGSTYSSLSGLSKMFNLTGLNQLEQAQKFNPENENIWGIEVYCDRVLITLLLTLMSKTLDSETAFGMVTSSGSYTGVLNDKGMFYGDNYNCVKVFGMEDYWGVYRRVEGFAVGNSWDAYVKMTYSTADGTGQTGYYYDEGSDEFYYGYHQMGTSTESYGYIGKCYFDEIGAYCPAESGGSAYLGYCDYFSYGTGTGAAFGGSSSGDAGAWLVQAEFGYNQGLSYIGYALSCKPSA